MKIYALVGPSGSGKSHRAPWISKEKNIPYIIDDGLLIHNGTIIAGRSAKREKTKIASVKTAVFTSDDHAFEVSHELKKRNAESLLILGTSDGMVKRIAERIGFDGVDETIYITDIASPEEIRSAQNMRRNEGKHVIPVPTLELKKDFSGIYLDPLNAFKKSSADNVDVPGERSVVRPTFSYLGKFTISEYAVYQLLEHAILESPAVSKITRFRVQSVTGGVVMETDLSLRYGHPIPETCAKLRRKIIEDIETATSLNVKKLTISVKNISFN